MAEPKENLQEEIELEIPESWLLVHLGDIVQYGSVQRAEPYEIPENAWLLELEDIEKDSSRLLQRVVSSNRKPKSTKNRFTTGDVLYGKLRPYLNKVLLADRDGFCTTEIVPIKPNEVLDGRYLLYWLKSPKFLEYVDEVSRGVNMPRLTTDAGINAPLVLAPLNEQKRIAEALEQVNSSITQLNEALEQVKRFRQGTLTSAIDGTLTEEWRGESNDFEDWEDSDLQSVAEIGTGSTPLRSNPQFFSKHGTPWITSAATGQLFVTSASQFVTDAAILAHRLKKYPIGTLLVAMYGEGKTRGQVTELAIEATINQACAAVIVDETLVSKSYVKIALQANYFQIRELAEGGSQQNLNLSKIKEFPLLLPPIEEQLEIVRRVEELFTVAENLETQYLETRTQLEQAIPKLLEKAFRGELVPQNPSDELASILLERIRLAREEEAKKPKEVKLVRENPMKKITVETLEEMIRQLPNDLFTFDEIRDVVTTDYETLRDCLFELLNESKIEQIFDQKTNSMHFKVNP